MQRYYRVHHFSSFSPARMRSITNNAARCKHHRRSTKRTRKNLQARWNIMIEVSTPRIRAANFLPLPMFSHKLSRKFKVFLSVFYFSSTFYIYYVPFYIIMNYLHDSFISLMYNRIGLDRRRSWMLLLSTQFASERWSQIYFRGSRQCKENYQKKLQASRSLLMR